MQGVVNNAIGIYFVAAAVLFIAKPEPVFDGITGIPRQFGTLPGQTLFTLQTVMTVMAIASYYYAAYF